MTSYLLIIGVIVIICIVLNKVSDRLGIPMLLAFIALGMFFGTDGVIKIPFEDYKLAEQVCSIGLIFIMFYGGFGTKWNEAKPVAVKSVLLSSIGVVVTALLTGVFCYYILHFELLESFLIGAVISSTDAASVFSILRSKRLNLKDHTASMLELESGSNDPFAYMLTLIILMMMGGRGSLKEIIYMLFAQVSYGILIGVIIAFIGIFILQRFEFTTDGFDTAFVLAIAILAYAIPTLVGGNGYLSVYIVGIILGNSTISNKRVLVHFFDGLTGLMQMLIFFLLGLLAFPSQLAHIFLPAIGIAVFVTFIARPIAVCSILTLTKSSFRQQMLVSWTGLRGAASIVFAIMATTSEAYMKNDIFHIVFCIVLLSIAIQGSLIPFLAKKLKMIDNSYDVLKTFNDYIEEEEVQFIKLAIDHEHPWKNKAICEATLPPDTLIVMIIRQGKTLIPKGSTIILEKDIIVLSAPSFNGQVSVQLTELKVTSDNKWKGKKIYEVPHQTNHLIILIKRNGKCIIPNGQTLIKENDVLVINKENS